MTSITVPLITKESGQYDREVIQRLSLTHLNISTIACLEGCTSLTDLDLSHNNISSTMGLEVVQTLQRLNLSFNNLRTIDQLAFINSLEYLDLRGNKIDSMSDLSVLSKLPNLKVLFLRGVDGEDANPVCSSSSYFKDITTKIPTLEILDGGHLGISMTFLEVEEHAKKLEENISKANKSESNSNIENWLSDSDKNSILSYEPKPAPELSNLEKQIEDLINNKASALLNRANEAINKAKLS